MKPSLVLSEDEKHDRFKNLKRKTDQIENHQEKRNLVCSPQVRCLIYYILFVNVFFYFKILKNLSFSHRIYLLLF